MWLLTTDGFFSAVEDRGNNDVVLVRARCIEDAELLAKAIGGTVLVTPSADYAYRVRVAKSVWAQYVADSANAIDYDNFKTAVGDRQGSARAAIYADVWGVLRRLQAGGSKTSVHGRCLLIGYPEDGVMFVTAGGDVTTPEAAEETLGAGWKVIGEGFVGADWRMRLGREVQVEDTWKLRAPEYKGAQAGWRLVDTTAPEILDLDALDETWVPNPYYVGGT